MHLFKKHNEEIEREREKERELWGKRSNGGKDDLLSVSYLTIEIIFMAFAFRFTHISGICFYFSFSKPGKSHKSFYANRKILTKKLTSTKKAITVTPYFVCAGYFQGHPP